MRAGRGPDPTIAVGKRCHIHARRGWTIVCESRSARRRGRVISMQTPKTDQRTAESSARRHGYTAVDCTTTAYPTASPRLVVVH
jgi:hypothetical protein